jgi:hypothetical protein
MPSGSCMESPSVSMRRLNRMTTKIGRSGEPLLDHLAPLGTGLLCSDGRACSTVPLLSRLVVRAPRHLARIQAIGSTLSYPLPTLGFNGSLVWWLVHLCFAETIGSRSVIVLPPM